MSEKTTCIVVGGGPAGMVAALLLARAGVDVTVLEKHADFLRDFRGDTVHPSTLRLLDELGLFDQFNTLPHTRLEGWGIDLADGRKAPVLDFTRLRLPDGRAMTSSPLRRMPDATVPAKPRKSRFGRRTYCTGKRMSSRLRSDAIWTVSR